MTTHIRHENGVTLPGCWFDGARKITPRPKPIKEIPSNAKKQAKVLEFVTHQWQDLRTISRAAEMGETTVRTALGSLLERDVVVTKWETVKQGKRRIYALKGDDG